MPVSKCNNCGATIPAGAAFCPSCGAPKAAEQPATQPMQQTTQYHTAYTGQNSLQQVLDGIFSTKIILLGILFGLLFVWIGAILNIFILPTSINDLTGVRVAGFLSSFGLFIMGIFTIGGGIADKSLDKFVRLGMVLGGIWLVSSSLAISYASLITARP